MTLDRMGWRGSPTGELLFDDCRVPAANLVGEVNQGVKLVMSGLDIERVFFSGHVIGLVQRMLADMYAALESVRAFS